MKNVTFVVLAGMIGLIFVRPAISQSESDINAKVAQLDIDTATLDDVIRIFGEPTKYIWNRETFTKDNLPRIYIAQYPNEFSVVMDSGRVDELRFESPAAGYLFRKKIRVGSSLYEALKVMGQPKKTVVGQPNRFKDGVLYKDIDGNKGRCYYKPADQNVRVFLMNYMVTALYVTRSASIIGKGPSPRTVQPIKSVEKFDDVRWKDMSEINLSRAEELIETLTFNQNTVWPKSVKMPRGCKPEKLLTDAMNPGLGVRELRKQGITGKGVNVAIIDQPLYLDHPEFAAKIVAYHDVGCGSESSMHGPAVASLLVGTNCGTAPGARVYYVAAPSWTGDAAYYAQALDWIVEQNRALAGSEKIRVVSVSAAPSGHGSPFKKNNKMWDRACARAEAAGIMVLDCTNHRGFIGPCWYDRKAPEKAAKCIPGFPGRAGYWSLPDHVLVPTCPRTTAEEYDKGEFGYQYCGRGGLSWAIPYAAGVLALGWQIRPDLTPEQMRELLFKSAYEKRKGLKVKVSNAKEFFRSASDKKKKGEEIGKPERSLQRVRRRDRNGAKIINPEKFIRLVRRAKATQKTHRSR